MSHVRSAVRYVPASSFRAVDPLDWTVTAEPQKRRRHGGRKKQHDSVTSLNLRTAWPLGGASRRAQHKYPSVEVCAERSALQKYSFFATDGFRSLIT